MKNFHVRTKGFSLLELMIVVVIIAILATIIYPSYIAYMQRGNRVDVQSQLMQMAGTLEQYKAVNHSYRDISIADLGGANYPKTGTPLYAIQLSDQGGLSLTDPAARTSTWLITATPTGTMSGNGVICLNHLGQKYWVKAAAACVLSATSTWE